MKNLSLLQNRILSPADWLPLHLAEACKSKPHFQAGSQIQLSTEYAWKRRCGIESLRVVESACSCSAGEDPDGSGDARVASVIRNKPPIIVGLPEKVVNDGYALRNIYRNGSNACYGKADEVLNVVPGACRA